MIIKNKRKITSMAVALAVAISSAVAFADDGAVADTADSSEGATVEADITAETTANGRDAPNFADILESSSIFNDVDIGIDTEVDIDLPRTSHNRNKSSDVTEKSEAMLKPDIAEKVIADTEVELNAVRSGTCGDNMTWRVDTTTNYIWNNTNAARYLHFEGSGEMNDYSSNSSPAWKSWLSAGTPVSYLVFDGNVTHIGDYAFYGARALEGIVDSVDDIVRPTWPYTINIPDTVTSIGSYAFSYTTEPRIWNIPNSVAEIGENAFLGINRFATVIIDNYKDAIPGAPWGHDNAHVIWLRGFETEPDEAEPELSKYNLQIDSSGELDKIEDWSLLVNTGNNTYTSTGTNRTYIKLTNVPKTGDLDDGTVVEVNRIADSCFEECTTLDATVDIANSITEIGNDAFTGSSAEKLSIDNFPGAVSGSAWGISETEYLRDLSIAETSPQPYTGSAITPQVSISLVGTNGTVYETLTQDSDFTASYSRNTNIGTATVNITYRNDYSAYSGTHSQTTFSITRRDISGEVTVSGLGQYPYTGSEIEPEPYVRLGTATLIKGIDYELSYSNNIDASYNARCNITFIGSYTGSVTEIFTITESTYTVTYSGMPVIYNFGEVPFVDIYEITLHCADGAEFVGPEIGRISIYEDDRTTFNAGETVGIWCSAWNGELADHGVNIGGAPMILTLPIEKLVFTQEDTVDMEITTFDGETLEYDDSPFWRRFPDMQYTGERIEFLFDTIYFSGDYGMGGGYDFIYSYRDNIQPGIGYVVIDFNYQNPSIGGTVEIPFYIFGYDLESGTVTGLENDYVYTGSNICPEISVTVNGQLLTKNRDYTLEFDNNIDAGTVEIRITGINAYEGEIREYFRIIPKPADSVYISPIEDMVFTGGYRTPEVIIVDNDR